MSLHSCACDLPGYHGVDELRQTGTADVLFNLQATLQQLPQQHHLDQQQLLLPRHHLAPQLLQRQQPLLRS